MLAASANCWCQLTSRAVDVDVRAQVTVHVTEAGGGPLSVPVEVRLLSPNNPLGLIQMTGVGGATTFGVAVGNYTAEVSAGGYRTSREEVVAMAKSGINHVYISLRRDDGKSEKASTKARIPELQGKSRKEMEAAVASLRDNKLADAQKHIDYALKHSPGHPDVQYVAALCALTANDNAKAREYLDAAVTLFPEHFSAQVALGGLLLQQGKVDDAILHLQKAVAAEPNAWRAHRLLSEAYLKANRDFDKAKFHASRALEFGKEKAVGTEITLALADAASGDVPAGRVVLEKFVHDNPSHPETARAKWLLSNAAFSPKSDATVLAVSGQAASLLAAAPARADIADLPTGPIRRLPANVDALVPAVDTGANCALADVLQGSALRASEFTDALQRFSATETFVHDELESNGGVRKTYTDSFQYLAALQWPNKDLMIVTEARNGRISVANLPVPYVTEGVPSIGLIFHASHAVNFNFTCEGLGHWGGQPAWQVRFEQRLDRPAQIHDWAERGHAYSAILKGRAWISTGSYHLLRIETDLIRPIPEVRLELHHMIIEYAPVKSANGKYELWLPASAEVFSRFRGRTFRQRHDFSEFALFSVDSAQEIKDPKPR